MKHTLACNQFSLVFSKSALNGDKGEICFVIPEQPEKTQRTTTTTKKNK